MSFKTILSVSGKEYPVKHFTLFSRRDFNLKGKPSSPPEWILNIYLDTVENDTTMLNWMTDPDKPMDGEIRLYKTDEDAKLKTIKFKNSYCYQMQEEFDNDIGYLTTFFKVAGQEIQVGESQLKNEWS